MTHLVLSVEQAYFCRGYFRVIWKPLLAGGIDGSHFEAGCPAVADPGADVVAIAQRKNLKVVPLVGPSSIILSVMGSGFNGQSFAFHGYLPIEPVERVKRIKQLEQRIYSENQTQLFIETPYRNHKMIDDLLQNCRPQTKLCIAANLTCEARYIKTRAISEWKGKVPDLSKIPCIFCCINNVFEVFVFYLQTFTEEVFF